MREQLERAHEDSKVLSAAVDNMKQSAVERMRLEGAEWMALAPR